LIPMASKQSVMTSFFKSKSIDSPDKSLKRKIEDSSAAGNLKSTSNGSRQVVKRLKLDSQSSVSSHGMSPRGKGVGGTTRRTRGKKNPVIIDSDSDEDIPSEECTPQKRRSSSQNPSAKKSAQTKSSSTTKKKTTKRPSKKKTSSKITDDSDEEFTLDDSQQANDDDNDEVFTNSDYGSDEDFFPSTPTPNSKSTKSNKTPSNTSSTKKPTTTTTKRGKSEEQRVFSGMPSSKSTTSNPSVRIQRTDEELYAKLPSFFHADQIRDKNGRRPDNENYDPSTLYVPDSYIKTLTPGLQQYWQFKRINYDKVVLFKVGHFYEIYHHDAILCHRLLELNWHGFYPLHVGFPEKSYGYWTKKLVDAGHRVVAVEQVETPEQMQARLKQQGRGKKVKLVKREVCEVLTKGTYIDKGTDYHTRWLMAVVQEEDGFAYGFTLMDASRNLFYVGGIKDDSHRTKFRTLLSQIQPSEIVLPRAKISHDVLNMLKNSVNRPILTQRPPKDCWSAGITLTKLDQYFSEDKETWPEWLKELEQTGDDALSGLALSSLGTCISYLESIYLSEHFVKRGSFHRLDDRIESIDSLVLDGQALMHLEVFEAVNDNGKMGVEGSLFNFMNRTVSPIGSRMLKEWVLSPLRLPESINERLDVVDDLIEFSDARDRFRQLFRKLPDFEKVVSSVYFNSVKRHAEPIYVENVSGKKLQTFHDLLKDLKDLPKVLNVFEEDKNAFRSEKLIRLITLDSKTTNKGNPGLFPDYRHIIEEFQSKIIWDDDMKCLLPQRGIDAKYDVAEDKLKGYRKWLADYLKEIRKRFRGNRNINYSHTKYRYELEVPEELVKGNRRPSDFEYTSKKAGYQRFYTKELKGVVKELEVAEDDVTAALNPFLWNLFSTFYENKTVWDQAVSCLGQLDCFCALAFVSAESGVEMCRPQIIGDGSQPFSLSAKNVRHPTVAERMPNFIPNDIEVCPRQEIEQDEETPKQTSTVDQKDQNVMIITGPNMGGKSTLLREACLAVIMAQIGCYAPATECVLSPADRIFTRIGASDRLLEGKSTFFVEMEETKNILSKATDKSLVVMDELGRGTSTFDGLAIADSVLRYIVEKIQCRVLFTTHYHMLLDEFRKSPNISLYNMSCVVDEETEHVTFLYKLQRGECPKSYGISVAKLAGIPLEVTEMAKVATQNFDKLLFDQSQQRLKAKANEAARLVELFAEISEDLVEKLNAVVPHV